MVDAAQVSSNLSTGDEIQHAFLVYLIPCPILLHEVTHLGRGRPIKYIGRL